MPSVPISLQYLWRDHIGVRAIVRPRTLFTSPDQGVRVADHRRFVCHEEGGVWDAAVQPGDLRTGPSVWHFFHG